jgi:glycosyltransferase involved in cell wall biosynthesis
LPTNVVRFSIIVPVYNTAAYLESCIAALRRQDYPSEDYEILMVDNNSTDDSAAILARAEGIKALHEPKQGSYAARNCALREAQGTLLAFTDSDCMPEPGWLRAIERSLEAPRVQVVLGYRRPAMNRGLVKLLSDYEAKKDEMVFTSSSPDVYYGFTNNMGVRRATYDRYGPFVERHRGADTIFVRRVVNGEGCQAVTYSNDVCVEHGEMDGVMSYYKKMYIYGRSRQLYKNIMKTRSLTGAERMAALRACLRSGDYSLLDAGLLVGVLAGGMAAWSLGSQSWRWQKPART